ncbi:MAG: SDR family NAD(P)-dependent oxidoreductase, partial [Solirubrobacterales bacterium]|nr:SDR family NAD(P)-dependent oxidoreductase [Solirubrobacterales bacterium]
MSEERWLLTGALGCIGTWCCRQLVREGHTVVAFDLGDDRHRAELVMAPDERAAVEYVRGDVTDLQALEQVIADHDVDHVVHLAAMLVPLAAA